MTPRDDIQGNGVESPTMLIVQPALTDVWFAVSTLADSGFQITVAQDFVEAKPLIDRLRPLALITDIRLGEYNGLHLVLRGKAVRTNMAAIVISSVADAVLQAEAERMQATFVQKPTSKQEFLAAVCRTLFRTPGDIAPIRPVFERRVAERRVLEHSTIEADRRRANRRRLFGPAAAQNLMIN